MITLIAAMGRNREIGLNNRLLWDIPEDMKHFKSYTMGKVLIMGSNTFASMGNRSLPGRRCVVVSSKDLQGASAIPAKSIDAALGIEHCYRELVVIGGARVYNQTIDVADKLVITHIDSEFTADTYFPEFCLKDWEINSILKSSNDRYSYSFVEYTRIRR